VADGRLRLTWDESAARPGQPKADGTGFGSRLLRQTVEHSLGGRFVRTIDARGLHFEMTAPTR